ncbi:MAG: LptF/LptG family permease [Bacteroidota bacterium]
MPIQAVLLACERPTQPPTQLTTFDLHIIRRFVATFLALVGGLIVFFVALHYVEYMDDFFDRGADTVEVFTVYYPNYLPEIIKLISPLALFLAAVFLTARMAADLQLTALFASGVSLYRLLRPYLLVGLVWTGFMVWFNGWVVPVTNEVRIEFEAQYFKDTGGRRADVNNLHVQTSPGSLMAVGFYDQRTQVAYRISIQQFDQESRLQRRVDARNMTWIDSLTTWRMADAVVRTFDQSEVRQESALLDTTLQVLPRDLARTAHDVERLTLPEAAQYVDQLQRSGAPNIGRPLVGLYSKVAYPFASVILLLIGVPMAAKRRRGGQAIQLGIALFVAFGYLAAVKLTEPFGYAGDLSPLLTVLLPHGLFFVLGLLTLWRVRT